MKQQSIVFRVDASLEIGTGHVMRCLTLAHALRERGALCCFVSRAHDGNLVALIRQHGFDAVALPASAAWAGSGSPSLPAHAAWVGADWLVDAGQTLASFPAAAPDWFIVDHYGLDACWEREVAGARSRVMVIDDLADREHDCTMLLDQNLGRRASDYAGLLPPQCAVLTGPQFALLRPEFAAVRRYSLVRRERPALRRILITMGGVDQANASTEVLKVLQRCTLPADCKISVVMGSNAPWLAQVQHAAAQMPWPTEVEVNVSDMAQRMADSDIAIGAAGGTAWERCCLGLPTLTVVLAANQWPGAKALEATGAALLIGEVVEIAAELPAAINALSDRQRLRQMGCAASDVTDGAGVEAVLTRMGL